MTDFYETDEQLGQYMDFHYGPEHFGVPNFPKTCADHCLAAQPQGRRALDLGCATGRSTLELAKGFDQVVGMDLSHRFIDAAERFRRDGELSYQLVDEGELSHTETVSLEALGLAEAAARVSFEEGDAGNLGPEYSGYDLIFAGNLIDRLYKPSRFLDSIHERINDGGLLVIASPYTWLEEHTPKEEWIGGFKKDGENYTTLDGLKDHLSDHVRLVSEPEKVPFVIRETQHKFQHTLSEVTIWERLPR